MNKSPDSAWNPESFLLDRVRELLERHYGVGPSKRAFEDCLVDIKGAGEGVKVSFNGLSQRGQRLATQEALAHWVTKKLLETEDGIDEVLTDIKPDPSTTGSPLYNACLETMRTGRGSFLSAEEIAVRIHYPLLPKRRRLRQLRRLLKRVCKDNGGRVLVENKAKVTYGFR